MGNAQLSPAATEISRGFLEGERIAKISVLTLLAVGIVELAFSQVSHSVALFADGIDSVSDSAVSLFVWLGLRLSRRPPSARFPYGYHKVESLIALVTALALVGVGILVLLRSYEALLNPHPISLPLAALVVLLAAGLVALYRSLQMLQIANRHKLLSLKLDARNSIKDATASFIAFGSVLLSALGFHQMDAIGGILIAGYIFVISYVAIKESSLVLADAFHQPELTQEIEEMIRTNPFVKGVSDLRLRRAGPFITGTVKVSVDPEMTVGDLDEVFTLLRARIMRRIPSLQSLDLQYVPSRKS